MKWLDYFASMTPDEKLYARDYPLHALAASFSSSGKTDDDEEWLNRWHGLIARGHDVNEVCSAGTTVWEMLEPVVYLLSSGHVGHAVAAMVKAGFNPLLKTRQPRGDAPTSCLSYAFLGAEEGSTEEAIGMGAIYGLIARDAKGEAFVSENGGNVFHVLSREAPQTLADVLDNYKAPNGMTPITLPHEWFGAMDHDGNTPLDLLWSKHGQVAKLETEQDLGEVEVALMCIFNGTVAIVNAEPALLTSKASGRFVWQAIDDCLKRHSEHQALISPELAARVEALRMEATTAPASSGPARAGMRL